MSIYELVVGRLLTLDPSSTSLNPVDVSASHWPGHVALLNGVNKLSS
jgi:hypothetical protein